MKALVKHASGPGNVDILDVPEPHCADNQVRVEVAFCGVCNCAIPLPVEDRVFNPAGAPDSGNNRPSGRLPFPPLA